MLILSTLFMICAPLFKRLNTYYEEKVEWSITMILMNNGASNSIINGDTIAIFHNIAFPDCITFFSVLFISPYFPLCLLLQHVTLLQPRDLSTFNTYMVYWCRSLSNDKSIWWVPSLYCASLSLFFFPLTLRLCVIYVRVDNDSNVYTAYVDLDFRKKIIDSWIMLNIKHLSILRTELFQEIYLCVCILLNSSYDWNPF